MAKTENAIGLIPYFYPVTAVAEDGTETYSTTSVLPDCVVTNVNVTPETIEQRKKEDISSLSMRVEFEAGEITPGQVTININPTTTLNAIMAGFASEEFGYAGKFVLKKRAAGGTETPVASARANLMEDFSSDMAARAKITGSLKLQLNDKLERGDDATT